MSPHLSSSPSLLIVGCGGIGGVFAATLHKAGIPLTICTTNEHVRRAWATTGPYLNGRLVGGPLPSSRIVAQPEDTGTQYDFVFVAVQPPQIESVAESLRGCLTEHSRVVCFSNGLCETRLAEVLGEERIIGAVVAWGARMHSAAQYERTSSGGFLTGTLNGRVDERMDALVPLLEQVGPVRRTLNLKGARMSKLVINCAISALGTVGGTTLGHLLIRREVRELGIALMREAVAVARAEGIELERVASVDLSRVIARDPSLTAGKVAQHAVLMAVGARYRRLRSSMLAAIERGREPSVNFINGEVCALGQRNGVPTPCNDAVVEIIWKIYRGDLKAGDGALQALYQRCLSEA